MPCTLELHQIRKTFPGTVALDDVSLRWTGGQVHALIGRNGAGKSTLVNILTGACSPTAGMIHLNGRNVSLGSPRDARDAGIAAVRQELSIVAELSVAENIFLGRLPAKKDGIPGRVDWHRVRHETAQLLTSLQVDIDPTVRAGSLPVAQQQLVEIAKAMADHPAILLLDEPTSALSQTESDHVFTLLRILARRGVLLIYITHRLHEIARIADTVTALRDGSATPTIPIGEATPEKIVTMMFGQNIRFSRMVDHPPGSEQILEVRSLCRTGMLDNISFSLCKGEILGIAGVLGSGRTTLLRAIAGAEPPDSGTMTVAGETVHPSSPAAMKRHGVVLTPENRKDQGLVQMLSMRANMCLASLDRIGTYGVTSVKRERRIVQQLIGDLAITAGDPELPVSSLSGGNQQKVVLGKWITTTPRVILFDEPTRGIDLQAKAEIFRLINRLSAEGVAAVVVSSELEELMYICHRILIMNAGRITGSVDPARTTLDELFGYCIQ